MPFICELVPVFLKQEGNTHSSSMFFISLSGLPLYVPLGLTFSGFFFSSFSFSLPKVQA